ncbi:MAG TPA: GtrA family protein [Gammaproteobacteria bacterium]|jgi:putative flippase GtrA
MVHTIRQQLVAFALIGAFATGVQYAVLAILVEGFAVHPVLGSSVGFALSALLNYRLNHSVTFGGTAQHARALPRFFAVAGSGLALNSSIMAVCYSLLDLHYLFSQLFATGMVFLWSFTGNRLWSFR